MDTGRPKREKKAVQHFVSESLGREKAAAAPLTIAEGKGARLRDLPNVEHRLGLTRTTAPALILLHRVLFPHHKAHPVKAVIKGHIRDFSGWTEAGAEEDARARLEKKEVKELKALASILDVSGTGSKQAIIDHIVAFCHEPAASGGDFKSKRPATKRRASTSKDRRGKAGGKKKARRASGDGEEDGENEEGEEEEEDEEDGEGDEEEGDDGEEAAEEDADGDSSSTSKKGSAAEDEDDESELSEEHRGALSKLRASIASILKGANLETLSVNKIREQLTLEHGAEVITQFSDRIKRMVQRAMQ